MSEKYKDILDEALALDEKDRIWLAEELIKTLPTREEEGTEQMCPADDSDYYKGAVDMVIHAWCVEGSNPTDGFLVGRVMRALKGHGNPKAVLKLVKEARKLLSVKKNTCDKCGKLLCADTRDGSILCWCSEDEE